VHDDARSDGMPLAVVGVEQVVWRPSVDLGMQDAINLAWKLAAEINGWAPHDLLDTYHRERHPVGARVVMHSRAQMALLSPGPNITALRELFGELLLDEGNVRHISDLMSGSDTRYDMRPTGPAHPLTGGWMPDLSLRDNTGSTSVAHLMRAARPVLLDLANRTELVEAAAHWSDRVDIVTATLDRPATADGVSDVDAVLIRPDGYVAWAAGGDTRDAIDGLQHALHTWFGRPVSRAG